MITNYLSSTAFEVAIQRLPNVEFFVQKINIPSLGGGSVEQTTPLNNLFEPRPKILYTDLSLSFIVDENMRNYLEIFYWMKALGSDKDFSSYAEMLEINPPGTKSDISILIQNSHKNANLEFTFYNAFPIDLSDIQLDLTQADVTYPECTATFKYDYFEITKVKS